MGSVALRADLERLAASGRFASVLLRLARDRFTGLLYAERDEGGAVVSFRDGFAVFFEDLAGGESLGDALLRERRVTPQQHAAIDARALSEEASSEDAAFCRAAVALGALTQEEVEAEIVRRIRGLLMQAVTWESARIELDSDADSLAGPEYPQALAPLVFTAVRAFFEDDRLHELLGDVDASYLRLLHTKQALCAELELDADDAALLDAFAPDRTVAAAIELVGADALSARQLVAMLDLGEQVQRSPRPFPREQAEPRARTPSSTDTRAPAVERGARARTPSATDTRAPAFERGVRAPHRPDTPGRYVERAKVAEERIAPLREPAAARASKSNAHPPAEAAARANARPVSEPQPTVAARPRPQSAQDTKAAVASPAAPAPRVRAGSPAQHERVGAARATSGPSADEAGAPPTPRVRSVRPNRAPEARPRRLGAALKRLGRELEARRTNQVSAPEAASVPASPQANSAAGDAGATANQRGAVRELVRMRRAQLAQQSRARTQSMPPGADLMRQAQEMLREQQFARAHDLMNKACEVERDNDLFTLYRLWAAFRANAIEPAELTTFRAALREKLNDDLHKGFAYYAMGHLLLADKKDEQAERFFAKAVELDKTNKDAARHLRLIELRRKTAAEDAKTNKIFGIEIGSKKS